MNQTEIHEDDDGLDANDGGNYNERVNEYERGNEHTKDTFRNDDFKNRERLSYSDFPERKLEDIIKEEGYEKFREEFGNFSETGSLERKVRSEKSEFLEQLKDFGVGEAKDKILEKLFGEILGKIIGVLSEAAEKGESYDESSAKIKGTLKAFDFYKANQIEFEKIRSEPLRHTPDLIVNDYKNPIILP